MFDIEYKGANCVVISTKDMKLVTDPRLSLVGLKDIIPNDGVEMATEARFALTSDSARLHIEGPGEYGIAGFDIRGIAAQRHLDTEKDPKNSTIYRVQVGGVNIAILGNVYENLTDDQLESLGVIDMVIIPVGGGGYTLDADGAAKIVRQIEPKVVIPVHYADSGLKYEVPQAGLEEFTKELGAPVEETNKYKLKSVSNLPEAMTIIKLNRS